MITDSEIALFERRISSGGVVLFPADTVYGLACAPDSQAAVDRLYEVKQRPARKPSAVMFFSLARFLDQFDDLPNSLRQACEALLPGAVTLLIPNAHQRFLPACGSNPEVLGVRVPSLDGVLAPLSAIDLPVMQSSANLAGEEEPNSIAEVPREIAGAVDLILDAGSLPGTSSTVIDLTEFAVSGKWRVVRPGAVPEAAVSERIALIS